MTIFGKLFKKEKTEVKKKVTKKPKKAKKPKLKKKEVIKKPRKVEKKIVKPEKKVKRKVTKKRVKEIKKKILVKKIKKPKVLPILKMADEKALDIAKKHRIPLVPYAFCKKEKDLAVVLKKIGFPTVMKVSSKSIIHKTDVSGVKTNINNLKEAIAAFNQLMKIKGCEKVLVQKQLSGFELIVGAKSDPNFGHIVSIGLGGIYVEILKDIVFRVCPINTGDAKQMVKELKGYDILAGMRGTTAINFDLLYDVIVKISRLAVAKKIKELDINPLFCNEGGCFAADIRIVE